MNAKYKVYKSALLLGAHNALMELPGATGHMHVAEVKQLYIAILVV